MRPTHEYTYKHYNADNGFPIASGIVRSLRKLIDNSMKAESEERHSRSKAGYKGKIVGRVAGPDAYHGKSANLRKKEQSSSKEDTKKKEEANGK